MPPDKETDEIVYGDFIATVVHLNILDSYEVGGFPNAGADST